MVSDIERYAQRRSRDCHADGEQLAPWTADERLSYEAGKHLGGDLRHGRIPSLVDVGSCVGQRREIQDQISTIDPRIHWHGIAAAGVADRGNVNRGAAIATNDVLSLLAISRPAADAASVER